VLVRKPDGSHRFCCDFREINKISRTIDYTALPRIDDTLDSLGGSQPKFFSTLDLRSGYWQVELDGQNSKDRSAFITYSGLYHFNVMPFGLKSAPSTFQRLMETVLRGLRKICLCYLDDVIIFSNTYEQHLEHIEQVFQALGPANLTLKPNKCFFFMKELKFLGFRVNEEGIMISLKPWADNIVL
jgi:hypothetical protein